MNIKSLLLGSAAALLAVSGARAADAVEVAAEPEPMEYVRVCDTYGTGYFYIPGTETCLRIGGYVRYDIGAGNVGSFDGARSTDQINGKNQDTWFKNTRFTLKTWTGQETELGTLKTYTETRINFGNHNNYLNDNYQENKGITLNFAQDLGSDAYPMYAAYLYFTGYLAAPLLGWHLESASMVAAMGALPLAAKVFLKATLALPFTYHSFNGLRHLMWDLGRGLTNNVIIKSGWTVVGLSITSALALAFL